MSFRKLAAHGRVSRALCRMFVFAALFAATGDGIAQHTIHVPADQPTIQAGIDAAANTDTVLVAPGTYYENIDFKGKAITVTSSDGNTKTILDGSVGKKPAAVFKTGEGPGSVLNGFTVQNGGAEGASGSPGGIYIADAMPVISNNIITHSECYGVYSDGSSPLILLNEIDNTQDAGHCGFAGGAAIWLSGSLNSYNGGTQLQTPPAQVTRNTIQNNVQSGKDDAGGNGGPGVAIWGAYAVLTQNIIRNNVTLGTGAVYAFNTDSVSLIGNLIYGNHATNTAGVALEPPGESAGPFVGILENNTIYGNTATSTSGDYYDPLGGSQVYLSGNLAQYLMVNNVVVGTTAGVPALSCGITYRYLAYTPLVFDHNDIFAAQGSTYGGSCPDQTGIYGNISADPLFANPGAADFHLKAGSPAIDAGNNSAPQLTATDLDLQPRVQDATGLGYPVVDMGAYEFSGQTTTPFTVLTLSPSTYYPLESAYWSSATPFTLTATLKGSDNSVPQGPVTFLEDMGTIGTVSVDGNGTATLQPSGLTPGLHAFLATYPGQGSAHPAVSVKFYVLFPKYTPTLTLTSSSNPAVLGTSITFTVTISTRDGAALSPVVLTDTSSNTTLATLTPNSSGVATYTTSTLTAGTHFLQASYAGDNTHNTASASLAQQVVDPNITSTVVTSGSNPSIVNSPVTFTASVTSSGGGTPTGTVSFNYGNMSLGSSPVSGSATNTATASITTAILPAGYDTVVATFTPAGSYHASSGSMLQQVVTGFATNTALASSPNPSNVGATVVLTATVTAQASGNGSPAGSVTFTDGTNTLGTSALVSGTASLSSSVLARGTHTITATYVPTGNFGGSSSSLVQTVNGAASTATLGVSPGTAVYGAPMVLTAVVTAPGGGTPTCHRRLLRRWHVAWKRLADRHVSGAVHQRAGTRPSFLHVRLRGR